MASINYPQGGTQNSVVEVLRLAGIELRDLLARHRHVTSRIHTLRIAVDALRELEADPVNRESARAQHGSTSRPSASSQNKTTANTSLYSRDTSRRRRTARTENTELRRACRIALMETDNSVSNEEVHARIVRRGSFFFADAESPAFMIAEQLSAMAEDGEICRVTEKSKSLWQRLSQTHVQVESARR